MVKRSIIEIDEDKCNGCGLCVPNCHEGALQIIDGKAKLVNNVYCDGLGNCLGHCPQDAIKIIEKDVKNFDLQETNEHLKKIGREELKENPLEQNNNNKNNSKINNGDKNMEHKNDLPCGCPGTMMKDLRTETKNDNNSNSNNNEKKN